jgi:hypothetical protein
MQIEFRAIVQNEYGAPEKVLRIAERQFKSEALGVNDVLVKSALDQSIQVISIFFPPFLKGGRSCLFRKEL